MHLCGQQALPRHASGLFFNRLRGAAPRPISTSIVSLAQEEVPRCWLLTNWQPSCSLVEVNNPCPSLHGKAPPSSLLVFFNVKSIVYTAVGFISIPCLQRGELDLFERNACLQQQRANVQNTVTSTEGNRLKQFKICIHAAGASRGRVVQNSATRKIPFFCEFKSGKPLVVRWVRLHW